MSAAGRPPGSLEARFDRRRGVSVPTRGNARLESPLERVNGHPEVYVLRVGFRL